MCKSLPLTCNTVHHILKKESFLLSELTVLTFETRLADQRQTGVHQRVLSPESLKKFRDQIGHASFKQSMPLPKGIDSQRITLSTDPDGVQCIIIARNS